MSEMTLSMYFIKKVGSVFIAVGVNFFLVPFELFDGGVIGLGLIIKYVTGIKAGLVIICVSLPIFIFALFHNKNYFISSLHGLLLSSFAIDYFASLPELFPINYPIPVILSAILGGILTGTGMGIMLRYKTSTGGTDLLAQFLAARFQVNIVIIIFILDIFIICLGSLLLSSSSFLLSAITILFSGVFTSICTWDVYY